MRYLVDINGNYLDGENWEERMGNISIEDFAKENNLKIVFDDKREQNLLLQEEYKKELYKIKTWFIENDWKANKIVTGEWKETDTRWVEYLKERSIKRVRQDELKNLLEA